MSSRSIVQIVCSVLLLTGCGEGSPSSGPESNEGQSVSTSQEVILPSPEDTAVEFSPTYERAHSQEEATLLLLGFHDEDLDPRGMPGALGRPSFEWKQPKRRVTWPVQSIIPLPQDPTMRFFAVIDVDGLGRLSLGDHLSPSQRIPENPDAPMEFKIDRTLTPELDEPADGFDSEVPSPLVETEVGPVPTDPDPPETRVSLTLNPRVPFLDRASVMLVGYPPDDAAGDQPLTNKPPIYLWQSVPVALTWPIELHIPTPSDVSLFLVVDLDGDGAPSRGDLATARIDTLLAEADQEIQQFMLDQVWWPRQINAAP
jgi:hypothetical protein